jgi:O-antigen/teichoic acid export membrane protein
VIGLPILTFVFYRADIFVIGKTCTKHDLGLYSMAATLALIPTQLFSVLISELALPLFSKIQNDYKSLNRALISMTQIIAYFGFPLTFFLVCYSEQLLAVTYGEKYRFVAIPFAIISIKSFFLLCSIPLAGLYFALGKPEKHRLFTIARALLIIILIYPFVNILGLVGAAIAGLLSLAVSFFLQLRQMKHLIELNLYKYNNILLKAFLFSLILPAVRMSTFSISTNSYVTHLVIGLSVFTIVSVFVLYYFHRSLISQKTR